MIDEHRRSVWGLNRTGVKVMVIGALVYGLVWGVTLALNLPNLLFVAINPAIVILVVIGLVWGPLIGFVVGLLGTFLGDFLIGGQSYSFYWDLAIGLTGFFAGIGGWMHFRQTWQRYVWAVVWGLLTVIVGAFLTTVVQIIFEELPPSTAWTSVFGPLVQSNGVNVIILTPLFLWLTEKFFHSDPLT